MNQIEPFIFVQRSSTSKINDPNLTGAKIIQIEPKLNQTRRVQFFSNAQKCVQLNGPKINN